jgi:hypothetical protein
MTVHVLAFVPIGYMGQEMSTVKRKILINLHQAAKVRRRKANFKQEKDKKGLAFGETRLLTKSFIVNNAANGGSVC